MVFGFIGYHFICKPLAFFFFKFKSMIINNFFNGFNIFEAYYDGLQIGRIVRVIVKFSAFLMVFFISKFSLEFYLFFLL